VNGTTLQFESPEVINLACISREVIKDYIPPSITTMTSFHAINCLKIYFPGIAESVEKG
jgi:hypothetical protein